MLITSQNRRIRLLKCPGSIILMRAKDQGPKEKLKHLSIFRFFFSIKKMIEKLTCPNKKIAIHVIARRLAALLLRLHIHLASAYERKQLAKCKQVCFIAK